MRWLLFAAVLLLAGCVPSLHPLFTPQDLVFDPGLTGQWRLDDARWEFTRAGDHYRLVMREKKERPSFVTAYLLDLDGVRYLDLIPDKLPGNSFQAGYLAPLHSFYRVWRNGDRLKLGGLDADWLKQAIARGSVSIPHVVRGGDLLLTAPTPELQTLVKRFADDPKAFPNSGDEFRRSR